MNYGSDDNYAASQSPLLQYFNKDIPTDIKELFRLIELISFNSGQVVSAVKKLTEFPITKPIFKTDSPDNKKAHEKIADIVKYKSVAFL